MRTTLPEEDLTFEGFQTHRFGLPMSKWRRLRGLSAIVTGAGTGYGQVIATALAGAGVTVALVGRRRDMLEETARKCSNLDGVETRPSVHSIDLCDTLAVAGMLDDVQKAMGNVALLVNSAALPCARAPASKAPLFSCGVDDWETLIRTNVTAPWFLSREFILRFHQQGPIRILNMTSRAGWAYKGEVGPYNVSKAALNNLTMSMAEEARSQFPDSDIQINALNPWEARTEMNRGSAIPPERVLPMALLLLAQPAAGPSGYFFCRNGGHHPCNDAQPYEHDLSAEME